MAYMSQDRKAEIAPKVKAILKKFNVKGSLAVRNHSTLVLNVKAGSVDFMKDYGSEDSAKLYGIQVNPYWYHEHFTGKSKQFLKEVLGAMNDGNHDRSDAQVDYFDVGWYVDVNIGKWNKPYIVEK
jgi:hypothetical protein